MENKLSEEILQKIQYEGHKRYKGRPDSHHPSNYKYVDGYIDGANEWAQWKVKCDELKGKYDNILATEDGHESQTENVWQSGFAAGHDAGYEKANHKVRNDLQKQFTDNDLKWAKENEQLKERAEKMEAALKGALDIKQLWQHYGPISDEHQSEAEALYVMEHKFIEALAWKGKEVKCPCPNCGKELSRDRNLCCRECGKEVGDD